MHKLAFVLLFVVAPWPFIVHSHPTPCNQGNDTMCVEGVRNEFTRTDYWFGDGYAERCPNGNGGNQDYYCMNPDTTRLTIASRFLRRENFDTMMITQFLHMRWNTPAGYYRACGHYYNVEPFAMSRDLDNTHTIYYDRWILSHRPSIAFNYQRGEKYTIIAYDAGYMRLTGMWVNIQTGDASTGYELFPHQGPDGAMWEIRNVVVYALFKQPNGTDITSLMTKRLNIEEQIRNSGGLYDASSFIDENQLIGPIGVGYLVVKTDAFAIQNMVDRGVFNNCPYLASKNSHLMMALEVIGFGFTEDNYFRDYRGAFLRNLEMNMEITYFSPEAHFDSCCRRYTYPAQVWTIDPHSEESVNSFMLRYAPMIKLTAVQIQQPIFGLGKLYTLLLLDITEASVNMTHSNTTVEWQVVNIPGNNIGEGDVVRSYRPPMVKHWNETRVYAFVLLRQVTEIDPRYMWPYTNPADCDGPDADRCQFNLGMMVNWLQLKMASVSVFYVEQDPYSRAVLYGSIPHTYGPSLSEPMLSKWAACYYVPSYRDPCPPQNCDTVVDQGHNSGGWNGTSGYNQTNNSNMY